jgi:hypothetical protein
VPPRPRRGRVPRAHGRKGGERRRSLDRHIHALPPAEPRTHTRVPIADALLVATHGAGPGSAAFPAATPLSRPTPNLAVTFTLRAHFPRACLRTRVHAPPHWKGTPAPPLRRRRRAHTGDGLHPRFCAPSSLATQGGSLRLPRSGRLPRRCGARRQRGHPAPLFFSWAFRQAPRVAAENTGLGCAQGATCRRGRSQSARIRCG